MDNEEDLVPCTHCGHRVPRSELRNGVCPECVANDY